jgi:hypothetical protein
MVLTEVPTICYRSVVVTSHSKLEVRLASGVQPVYQISCAPFCHDSEEVYDLGSVESSCSRIVVGIQPRMHQSSDSRLFILDFS